MNCAICCNIKDCTFFPSVIQHYLFDKCVSDENDVICGDCIAYNFTKGLNYKRSKCDNCSEIKLICGNSKCDNVICECANTDEHLCARCKYKVCNLHSQDLVLVSEQQHIKLCHRCIKLNTNRQIIESKLFPPHMLSKSIIYNDSKEYDMELSTDESYDYSNTSSKSESDLENNESTESPNVRLLCRVQF
jgi:hypothetical protein